MALASSASGLAFAAESPPQYPRFRVTDLTNLDVPFSALSNGTMGINNKGQVVYGYSSSGVKHAWFWLPETDYDFPANTIYTLDSTSNDSIARDINESGRIVGYSGSSIAATMWTLSSGSVSATTLSDTQSEAHALNNGTNPTIVGWRRFDEDCSESSFIEEALAWVPGIGVERLVSVGDFAGEYGVANDIRRNSDDLIVGISENCARSLECYVAYEGTVWDDTQAGALLSVGTVRNGADSRLAHPYGVNNAGNIVGWIDFDPAGGPQQCFPTAVFWEDLEDAVGVDLSAYLAEPYERSQAFAVNSLANPQVVGANRVTENAILWEYLSGWTSTDLNDSGSPNYVIPECSDDIWKIREAHVINDDGWIVAIGTRVVSTNTEHHALLLTPVGCPFDVNGDGVVDYYDSGAILLQLLTPNQECPSAKICIWDVDFDCHITDDDYDAVLEFIGECTFDPCTCEGESGFASTPGGGHSLERFIEALASIEAQLTEGQLAFAWERFLHFYYQ